MELVAPGLPQHHLPFALEVFGELDFAILQLSLDLVVERHEALRTIFADDRGELRQITSGPRPSVTIVDVPSGPDFDLHAFLREQVAAPFDLGRGPLVRLVAVRRAPNLCVLVFVLHHIIADNLSLGLFLREMAEVYDAISARRPPALAPLPWQYADFAIAEAAWLGSRVFRDRLHRYAEKLRPAGAQLDLGPGRSLDSGPAAVSHLVALEARVVDRLKRRAQQSRVTLFAVLLAALQKSLASYADGPDFVIAVPIAGRGSDGAQNVIGPFANIVAVKTSFTPGQTMAEMLVDVGGQLLDALEYENIPWDALVRAVNPARSAAAAPLSQVMFSSIAPMPFQRFGRLPCRPVWLGSPAPPAELFVSATENDEGGLWLGLDGQADKVSPGTLSRLSGALRTALLEIADGDTATLAASPIGGIGGARPSFRPVSGARITASATDRAKSSEASRPSERLETLVVELWQEFLGAPPVHSREDFFAAGGDSLLAVRLISALCRRLDRKLPVSLFLRDPTVAGIAAALVETESGGEPDHAVTKIAEGANASVLFISGTQRDLAKLAASLQPGPSVYKLDVYWLQEQRLLAGKALFDTIEGIAAELRQRLKAIQPRGPYLLAGSCEGGVVAYEIALQLQREGEQVGLLAELDTPVRGFWESRPAFLGIVRNAKRRLHVYLLRIRHANSPEFDRHLYIWATIWQAVRSYCPHRAFDGDVHQFKAAPTPGVADVVTGWDRRVTGRVFVHRVPGRHHTWMRHPRSGALLRATLDAAVRPATVAAADRLGD